MYKFKNEKVYQNTQDIYKGHLKEGLKREDRKNHPYTQQDPPNL